MKRFTLFLILLLAGVIGLKASDVVALLSYSTFKSPEKGPYVETYLTVFGNTVVHKKNKAGNFQGQIEVSLLFKQNDSIRGISKFTLAGPEIADTTKGFTNFIDLQRFALPNGIYKLEFSIADKNRPKGKEYKGELEVVVSFRDDILSMSDIEFVESYAKASSPGPLTKSGYDLVPYVSNFFPENLGKITFYGEVYNAQAILGTNTRFLATYYIENYINRIKLPSFSRFSTHNTAPVVVLLSELSIADLPSGAYNLVVEIRDKNNELVMEKRAFFQRKNPNAKLDGPDIQSVDLKNTFAEKITSVDTLRDFIRSLRPISTENEKNFSENQVINGDLITMQKYFYSFWTSRNALDPETGWKQYKFRVDQVNKIYSTNIHKGYDTDRGRVFLQYGPPDDKTISENEPNVYPYEIWHYYKLKDQTNKRFVFYNRDLVTNNYTLLHSDARGEINDYRWQMKLKGRTHHSSDLDVTAPGMNNYGDRINDNFLNPR
jgi:GWxTD domain-containing protein